MSKLILVESLEDAYKQGYFCGSITRYELFDILTKRNKQLRYIYGKNSLGLYDTDKAKYVAAVGNINPIPQFTIYQKNSKKVLCKSYKSILKSIRRQGYEID